MLRRLFTLILALTCAFAPATWAFELNATADANCCCGTKCPCPPTDCAPAPAAPARATAPSTSALEQRAEATRPRARVATAFFAHFLSAPLEEPALRLRSHPAAFAPADSVALFQAHCSLLL